MIIYHEFKRLGWGCILNFNYLYIVSITEKNLSLIYTVVLRGQQDLSTVWLSQYLLWLCMCLFVAVAAVIPLTTVILVYPSSGAFGVQLKQHLNPLVIGFPKGFSNSWFQYALYCEVH